MSEAEFDALCTTGDSTTTYIIGAAVAPTEPGTNSRKRRRDDSDGIAIDVIEESDGSEDGEDGSTDNDSDANGSTLYGELSEDESGDLSVAPEEGDEEDIPTSEDEVGSLKDFVVDDSDVDEDVIDEDSDASFHASDDEESSGDYSDESDDDDDSYDGEDSDDSEPAVKPKATKPATKPAAKPKAAKPAAKPKDDASNDDEAGEYINVNSDDDLDLDKDIINPANIVEGKRARKPVTRYRDPRYLDLMLNAEK
jgi:hypothetical protein